MQRRLLAFVLFCITLAPLAPTSSVARPEGVAVRNNQLYIDGIAQPQLFGAELQYFRLRGGAGRNIPREKVIDLWAKALDRMKEAKMNAISFYIPWDFHEYAEGKFDFTGTADEDGDGNPDYPSRDIFTFLKMVKDRGINVMMVRPGPYINAEWGFLGFGAIPEWFHQKFPDSHMRDARGLRNKLYDYHDPHFLHYTRRWFAEVYRQVIQPNVGPGKPIAFVQLDNETNYMWNSVYIGDFSAHGLARYRNFLRGKYQTVVALNEAQGTELTSWNEATPPREPKKNIAQDRDWYEFQDGGLHTYLKKVRAYWEELGLREPDVLFTLAESYNAPAGGLLPNYRFRNDPGATGVMTVNLYPKTYDTDANPLFNLPFKSDHDVKSAESATDYYFGSKQAWVMGPEIQGGWWRGVRISPEARQQTYLSTLGHGVKALFVYYFHEGDNFGALWAKEQVQPRYEALRKEAAYRSLADDQLPEEFWNRLQETVDREVITGIPAWHVLHQTREEAEELFFDAPLDGQAKPRGHFQDLKALGERLIFPYRDFLGKAVAVEDRACLVKDNFQHEPSPNPAVDSGLLSSEWSGGLLGWIMQTGANPRVIHWGLNPAADLDDCSLVLYQDNGATNEGLLRALRARFRRGATVVSFLESSVAKSLGFAAPGTANEAESTLYFRNSSFRADANLTYRYELSGGDCTALLTNEKGEAAGYECAGAAGGRFVQIGALPYRPYNSDGYGTMTDAPGRLSLARYLVTAAKVKPFLELGGEADRTVAFARTVDQTRFWITAKTGAPAGSRFTLKLSGLAPGVNYRVRDLLGSFERTIPGRTLGSEGFAGELGANGSTVYLVEKADAKP